MENPWKNDSCEHIQSYYSVYPVPVAAALWCNIPPDEVQQCLKESTQVHRSIYRHPYIQCLEPRCRAMHEAIEKGALLVCRESGRSFDGSIEHVAPERRHVTRQNLKDWIAREFPSDRPPFLFDEIERKTHAAINADTFLALQADRDAARAELEKAKASADKTLLEMNELRGERDSLKSMVEKRNPPAERSEKTYLNIIGGLLAIMLDKSPSGNRQSIFEDQAAIVSVMLGHYGHIRGMGDSNLEKIMAAANKTLKESTTGGG